MPLNRLSNSFQKKNSAATVKIRAQQAPSVARWPNHANQRRRSGARSASRPSRNGSVTVTATAASIGRPASMASASSPRWPGSPATAIQTARPRRVAEASAMTIKTVAVHRRRRGDASRSEREAGRSWFRVQSIQGLPCTFGAWFCVTIVAPEWQIDYPGENGCLPRADHARDGAPALCSDSEPEAEQHYCQWQVSKCRIDVSALVIR
jgi:hypothetical protein